MRRQIEGLEYKWEERSAPLQLPVRYEDRCDYWNNLYGELGELKRDTEATISACHVAATLVMGAVKLQPEIYQLGVGVLKVFYTVEEQTIVVRGYSPNLPGDEVPEEFSGGFVCSHKW